MSYSSPPLAQRRVQIGSEKGSTPKKVHYFDKDGAPSEIESASPLRGAPLKGALKGSSGSSAGGRPTTQEPTARRFSVCNILKFLALFKSKSLLQVPLYYILKESLLSGEDKLLAIFAKYDLAVLAEERNMLNLQILFEKIEQFARSKVEEWLGNYYGEDELMESHHISNNSSMQGTALEKQERSTSLIYGEVEFESFSKIMDIATTGLKGQVKFTDLGSGTGKACFWVALTTSFKEIYGIEILSELHIKAMKTLHALRTEGSTPQPTPTDLNSKDKDKDSTDCGIIPILPLNCDLCFIEGSFLRDAFDWSDSDLVFANSTCFPAELMAKLAVKSQLMRQGSRFITFTASLNSPYWRVIYRERLKMSWGFATVFVHERLGDAEAIQNIRDQGEREMESEIKYGAPIDE